MYVAVYSSTVYVYFSQARRKKTLTGLEAATAAIEAAAVKTATNEQ